jgi:hypothetical protein
MLCFFRSLIDFDWIEGYLISGRVGFGSGHVSLTFLKNRIRSDLDPDGSVLAPLLFRDVPSL